MQCWSHLPVLALLLLGGHALGQVVGDTTIGETTIENSENLEHSSKELPSPKSASEESESSPARQRPQQGGSWGGLLSGLLGTITKTADVSDCPGKCLHALASLLCEEVKEEIACPSQSMRCCVDRKHLKKPPQNLDEATDNRLETTTNYRVRPVPSRTTTKATTTTTKPTTTRRPPAVASDKQDKFGDYDYTDSTSDTTSSASTTSKTASVFFAAVLCMTFYFL